MTLNELQNQIKNYLTNRDVKDPKIRMNAFQKIRRFMEENPTFIVDEHINLNLDREKFSSQYLTYKTTIGGSGKLSGAENHVIKLIYDYYGNKN